MILLWFFLPSETAGIGMLDGGARRGRVYARRANSEDSIEVLSTTESIFPEDLTAISEEEAEQQQEEFLTNGPQHELLPEEVVRLHKIQTPASIEVPPEEEEEEQLVEEEDEEGKPAAMTEAAPGK